MFVTGSFGVFVAVLVVLNGCEGVPRPCPQFLPVAVTFDQNMPSSYSLRSLVEGKDEKENVISKNPENNFVASPADLLLPDKETTSIEKSNEPKLLQLSELSTVTPETGSQKPKKRRRIRRPKEPKKIVLSQNSNWALRTINDKPAVEVLMTDKASVARDLKDATESSLVSVKKLEDQKR